MTDAQASTGDLLADLIAEIRALVAEERPAAETSGRVATALTGYLSAPDLLPESARVANPDHYKQNLVHVEEDGSFSIVALVWLPGQRTPVHDHVSWCVVGVHEGDEAEVLYRLDGEGDQRRLVRTAESTNPQGSTSGFAPPGDLHEVWNAGDDVAISIHVYGADIRRLGSSIRRRYDFPIG